MKHSRGGLKLGNICTVLAILIVAGYLMFISTVFYKSHPSNEKLKISNEKKFVSQITELAAENHEKDKLIKRLRRNIESSDIKIETINKEPVTLHRNKNQESDMIVTATPHPKKDIFSIPAVRPGVIVLGMHRSGTSIVGGLLSKMGLNVGDNLIGAAEDNSKGFFERVDVVLQNDWLFRKQNVHYSVDTFLYNPLQGLKDIFTDKGDVFYGFVSAKEGQKALKFYNDPSNYPWMMKDPRLCITIRTWLPLLNFIPAVLFTYRHPLDVALSMHHRESENFAIGRALRMWYVYNKRSILQSQDLCRVISSHARVMKDPIDELNRIYEALLECGVPIPHRITREAADAFVDPHLQHGKTALVEHACLQKDPSTIFPPSESWSTKEVDHIELYREVIRLYCALEDGTAFYSNFQWDENIKD